MGLIQTTGYSLLKSKRDVVLRAQSFSTIPTNHEKTPLQVITPGFLNTGVDPRFGCGGGPNL